MRKTVTIIAFAVFIISVFGIIFLVQKQVLYKNKFNDLENSIIIDSSTIDQPQDDNQKNRHDIEKLSQINSDVVGWLSIEGTTINYPVMENIDEIEFYLDHDFYKNIDPNGLPFLDERNTSFEDDNTVIYGHNMKTGLIFHDLEKYKDLNFFKKNNIITIETMDKIIEYKIIAVLKEKIDSADSFDYNMFTSFNLQEEKEKFINDSLSSSIHSIDYGINLGKKLLTLSTCDNLTMDGRIAVIAVEI